VIDQKNSHVVVGCTTCQLLCTCQRSSCAATRPVVLYKYCAVVIFAILSQIYETCYLSR